MHVLLPPSTWPRSAVPWEQLRAVTGSAAAFAAAATFSLFRFSPPACARAQGLLQLPASRAAQRLRRQAWSRVVRRASRIAIHMVGKPCERGWEATAVADYSKRLAGGAPSIEVETQFHKTDEQLVRAVDRCSGHTTVVLDEKGALLTSEEFEELVFARLEMGGSRLAFVIGGADGLPPVLRSVRPVRRVAETPSGSGSGSRELFSLGKLTLPHRLARVLLMEQLYRAQQIRRGTDYHRGEPL